jgi:hypothetical protein
VRPHRCACWRCADQRCGFLLMGRTSTIHSPPPMDGAGLEDRALLRGNLPICRVYAIGSTYVVYIRA